MNRISRFFVLPLAIITAAALIGCSDDDENVIGSTPAPAAQTSIRVIHTSYDAPSVDIAVDGSVAVPGLGYGASSGYASLPAGSRDVAVTPAGATTPVVIQANLPLDANKSYTVFAVDQLSNIEPIFVEDMRVPTTNKVKVRFLHASPDAPAVDIRVGSNTGAVAFGNRAFKAISDYIEIDGGTYTFVVTAGNTTTEVITLDPVTLTNGSVLTIVAHGTFAAGDAYPFGIRAFIDNDPGNTFIDLTF